MLATIAQQMKMLRSVMALGAFFVVVISLAACGSSVPSNSVADVAGNPITTEAFNHWMYVAAKGSAAQSPGQPVIVPTDPPNFNGCIAQARKEIPSLAKTPTKTLRSECAQLFTSLSSQVMDFLIRSYWYQAQAAGANVKVTDKEVQQQFAKDKAQQFPTASAYDTFLKQTGQTQEDILYRVRVNLIYSKLLKQHTKSVTDAQIANYFSAHQSQFGTPETRNIRFVLAKNKADADAAKAALASGQSWNDVAKKYSTDATTKNNGGLLTGVTKGQEDAALDQAAFSAPAHKLMGPIKAQLANGYYVFDVDKITPATQQTLTQATPQIKQLLSSQSQSSAQSTVDNAAKKKWLGQTKCRSGYSMTDCSGYKTPTTSSTAAPTTTAPAPTATTAPPTTTAAPTTTTTSK
jgi:foldase protein PrsA